MAVAAEGPQSKPHVRGDEPNTPPGGIPHGNRKPHVRGDEPLIYDKGKDISK